MQRFCFLILIVLVACGEKDKKFVIDDAYRARFPIERLTADRNGYLQLIGLFELNPLSANSFGSDIENDIVLKGDSLPARLGSYTILGDSVFFDADENIYVLTKNDSIVDKKPVQINELLRYKRWRWMVIKRVGKFYLRIWDRDNPDVQSFKGYEKYPLTTEFIFDGTFSYYPVSKKQTVQSELGEEEVEFIGKVSFEYDGEMYSLDVGKNGFTMIGDKTTAIDTYGGGRYLYLELPEKDGPTIVDFNFCYNPPCAFSRYTTCLLPPKQNILPFEILAGEKYSDH